MKTSGLQNIGFAKPRLPEIMYGVTDTDFNYLGMNHGVTDIDLALLFSFVSATDM